MLVRVFTGIARSFSIPLAIERDPDDERQTRAGLALAA